MATTNVVRDEWLYIIRTGRQGGKCAVECQNAGREDRKFARSLAKAIEAWIGLRIKAETRGREGAPGAQVATEGK